MSSSSLLPNELDLALENARTVPTSSGDKYLKAIMKIFSLTLTRRFASGMIGRSRQFLPRIFTDD
jgi:hypothetical protein